MQSPVNRKLIIVTSVYPPEVGGPGVYFASLKEAMEKRGCAVEVLVRPDFFTLLSKIKKTDTVLAHATPKILLPIYAARMLKKFPLIIRVGGDFFWERAVEQGKYFGTLKEFYKDSELRITDYKSRALFWFLGIALRKADAVVYTSAFLKETHIPLFSLDDKKTHVITHPIPELRSRQEILDSRFRGNDRMESGSNQKDEIRLLYAGRFLKLKNLHMLIEVFAEARKRHPNMRLTLIGEGPERKNLESRITDCGLEKSIIFKESVSHDKILEEMASADLVVLPSLSEVSPNLLTDALSTGTPILATRENGLRDVVRDEAVWFDPMSKEDFSAKLEELLAPEALSLLREKMKERPYRRTWSEVAREYENIFQQSA